MMDPDPLSNPAPPTSAPPKPAVLAYETAWRPELPGDRPKWVYGVFAIYGLLALALLTAPMWVRWLLGEDCFVQTAVCVTCAVLCGASLMILPVRVARRRTITRRSIWIPLIGSGFLAGFLIFGAGLALDEYFHGASGPFPWPVLIGSVITWFAWAALFAMIAYSDNPQSIGMRLHRWLIAGSVMELLIAVPAHIIVRRRQECCAGIATGFAICIGVTIMFLSFGPSVLLLFYKRRRQITVK